MKYEYEYEQGVKLLGMKYKSYHLVLRPRSLLIAKTTTPKRVKKHKVYTIKKSGISLVYTYCTCCIYIAEQAAL